ncbi:MAG: hypothetical protein CM15mP21_5320 [Hyphomicrobiales bacterium]|nr:MAG: hypothetical protein CM15mP21_5320 [Hyphomicrobiales bacterium]
MVVAGCVISVLRRQDCSKSLQLQIIGKTESISLVCPHIKSNEIAAARHLPTGEIILRMGFVAGINHTPTFVMSVQKSTSFSALSQWASTRTGSVSRLFSMTQALKGLAPGLFDA